jgi:hypothetical protein
LSDHDPPWLIAINGLLPLPVIAAVGWLVWRGTAWLTRRNEKRLAMLGEEQRLAREARQVGFDSAVGGCLIGGFVGLFYLVIGGAILLVAFAVIKWAWGVVFG